SSTSRSTCFKSESLSKRSMSDASFRISGMASPFPLSGLESNVEAQRASRRILDEVKSLLAERPSTTDRIHTDHPESSPRPLLRFEPEARFDISGDGARSRGNGDADAAGVVDRLGRA